MNKLNGMILGLALVVARGIYAAEQEPTTPRTKKIGEMVQFLDTTPLDAKHAAMLRDVVREVSSQLKNMQNEQEAKKAKAQEEIERIEKIRGWVKKDLEA